MIGPVPQDQAYHHFADTRAFLGVPNFADVCSSLPLVAAGLVGVALLSRAHFASRPEARAYAWFCWAIVLAGIGSAYYHLAPDDVRLAADRLPIAVAFMCLLTGVLVERLDTARSVLALALLAALGAASVLYWRAFDDLRPYALVQFGSLATIVLLCAAFRSRYTEPWLVFAVAAIYGLAKLCELRDVEIYALTGRALSGHTLKHLLSAVAICGLIAWLVSRRPRSASHRQAA